MLLYTLYDLQTGAQKDIEAPSGTTERQVRMWYGGIWLDFERVLCPPPVFVLVP